MLFSVLNCPRAVHVNIEIMRAFVRLREVTATNRELAEKLAELERRISSHDEEIQTIQGSWGRVFGILEEAIDLVAGLLA